MNILFLIKNCFIQNIGNEVNNWDIRIKDNYLIINTVRCGLKKEIVSLYELNGAIAYFIKLYKESAPINTDPNPPSGGTPIAMIA